MSDLEELEREHGNSEFMDAKIGGANPAEAKVYKELCYWIGRLH